MLQNKKGALFYTMMVAEIMILLAFVVIIGFTQSQADLNQKLTQDGKTITITAEEPPSDDVKKFLFGNDVISDPWSKLVNIETLETNLAEIRKNEKKLSVQLESQENNERNINTLKEENESLKEVIEALEAEKNVLTQANRSLINAINEANELEDPRESGGVLRCWYHQDEEGAYKYTPFLEITIMMDHFIIKPIWQDAPDQERRTRQAELLGLPTEETRMNDEDFRQFGARIFEISVNNEGDESTDVDQECRFFVDTVNTTDSDTRRNIVSNYFYFRHYQSDIVNSNP